MRPVCLEMGRAYECGECATHEVWDSISGAWTARCEDCTKFYRAGVVRALSHARSAKHFSAQWDFWSKQ